MKIIEGGGQPDAHMHRRVMPNCDWCGAELKGRLPKPYWVADSFYKDKNGNPLPGTPERMYLCKEHRQAMKIAMDRALRRDMHRQFGGQRMFPDLPHLHGVDD